MILTARFIWICLAIVFIALSSLWKKLKHRLTRRALIRKHGCKEPRAMLDVNLAEVNSKSNQEHKYLETTASLFATYGRTHKVSHLGKTVIRTCDPEVVKAVYSTQFEKFGLQPIRYKGGTSFFGNGIIVTDGAQWKASRALVRPTFDIAHIANLDQLRRHVGKFLEILPRDGSTIDLMPLFKRLTLDVSSEFIFGKSMDALSSPEACEDFLHAFMAAQRGVVMPKAAREPEWDKYCKKVLDYIDERVNEAFERATNDKQSGGDARPRRIVDDLVKQTEDRHSLRYLVLSIFSPSHDTVAVTLSNAFFHLARNPDVWEKLRAEILPSASQPLTYELLNSYKYLTWVFKETHRLTPLATQSTRACLSTTALPTGGGIDGKSPLLVQEGEWVEIHLRQLHRDKSYWGEDAEQFNPARWGTIRPTWEYLPFSGGPRICPAMRLVYTECEYIMAVMAREFKLLENRDPVMEWVEERRLIFQSRNGTKVGLIT